MNNYYKNKKKQKLFFQKIYNFYFDISFANFL